jgi:hypothetical protein
LQVKGRRVWWQVNGMGLLTGRCSGRLVSVGWAAAACSSALFLCSHTRNLRPTLFLRHVGDGDASHGHNQCRWAVGRLGLSVQDERTNEVQLGFSYKESAQFLVIQTSTQIFRIFQIQEIVKKLHVSFCVINTVKKLCIYGEPCRDDLLSNRPAFCISLKKSHKYQKARPTIRLYI